MDCGESRTANFAKDRRQFDPLSADSGRTNTQGSGGDLTTARSEGSEV